MKNKITDFLCAFIITFGVFVCLALLCSATNVENQIFYDAKAGQIHFFDTTLQIDKGAFDSISDVFAFNDILLSGTCKTVEDSVGFAIEYISDAVKICFNAARMAVGAA